MKELESYSYFEELNNDKLFSFVTNKNMNINYAKQSRDEIRDILIEETRELMKLSQSGN